MSRIATPGSEINTSRFPIIGKIKIGEKRKNGDGKEYPTSLDYFRADGKYAEHFNRAYGDKPSKIQIIFISDNTDEVCNERFEYWNDKGRKVGYGDGLTFYLYNEKSKEYDIKVSPEEAKTRTTGQGGKWSVILTLRFLLPQIKGVGGVWELNTKGVKSSVKNLRDTFDTVMDKAGRVRGVPFDLIVQKHTSRKPGVTSVYPVIDLVPNLSTESLAILSEYGSSSQFDKTPILNEQTILALGEKK